MSSSMVSIVVPIYNIAKYLNRCIESLVNQTYKNIEIILVDDGSPDRCPQMCEEWAKKDSRIKVIHKSNAGLGMARNTGIDEATGEYVYFVDGDDYVALDVIEKCVRLAKAKNAEIVTFGYSDVELNGEIGSTVVPCADKEVYTGSEVQNDFLPDLIGPNLFNGVRTNLFMSACATFVSMTLIRKSHWRFVSEREIISEDIYSLLILYQYVYSVAVISEPLYFYCKNETSLTHTYRADRYPKIMYFYDRCVQETEKIGYNHTVKQRLAYPYLSNTIAALKMVVSADLSVKERRKAFYDIVSSEHLHRVLNDTCIKKETLKRKLFLSLIKAKCYKLCYLLIKATVR